MKQSKAVLDKLNILQLWVGEPPDYSDPNAQYRPGDSRFFEITYGIESTEGSLAQYQWSVTIFPPNDGRTFSHSSTDLNHALYNTLSHMMRLGYFAPEVLSHGDTTSISSVSS